MYLLRKPQLSENEIKIKELKEELKTCDQLIKSCQSMFELTTDDYLIESRIYQLLSLSKHREYLMHSIRVLSVQESMLGQV